MAKYQTYITYPQKFVINSSFGTNFTYQSYACILVIIMLVKYYSLSIQMILVILVGPSKYLGINYLKNRLYSKGQQLTIHWLTHDYRVGDHILFGGHLATANLTYMLYVSLISSHFLTTLNNQPYSIVLQQREAIYNFIWPCLWVGILLLLNENLHLLWLRPTYLDHYIG